MTSDDLLQSAHEIFLENGYKKTNISDITKLAGIAVGSFYKYFDSKEAIFLEVYKQENNRIRKKIIEEIDWAADFEVLAIEVMDQTISLIGDNKIIREWQLDNVSQLLKEYYRSEEGMQDNQYYHFLLKMLNEQTIKRGFTQAQAQELLKVFKLISFVDLSLDTSKIEDYQETVKSLLVNYLRGFQITYRKES